VRLRGVHHVEVSVINYDESINFYDKMFGWLGFLSFWTLDVEYRSTYYMTKPPFPHSYIGIQPAKSNQLLNYEERAPGIHHIALWAKSKQEVGRFYQDFLLREQVSVTDPPEAYPHYAPGYYAVFFLDPSGIRWELAHLPKIPMPWDIYQSLKVAKELKKQHPEWKHHPMVESWRKLPKS
jgi:catechol 2,3-dioxygenase-like lactoylglutathione lyase family enzyme